MSSRIEYIDNLKGFAILLVVIGHATQLLWPKYDGSGSISSLYTIIYTFHMPLFFFLSGLCARTSKVGGVSLVSKVITLLYPHIIWRFLANINETHFDPNHTLFSVHGDYWFLIDLFYMFCACKFLQIIEEKINPKHSLAIDTTIYALATFTCIIIGIAAANTPLDEYFKLSFIQRYFLYFALGYLCKKYDTLLNFLSSSKAGALFTCLFIIGVFIRLYYWDEIMFSKRIPDFIIGCSGGLCFLSLFKNTEKNINNDFVMKCLNIQGKKSLEIYLIHPFLFIGLGMMSNVVSSQINNVIVVVAVTLSLAVFNIFIILQIIKLIDGNNWLVLFLFGRGYKKFLSK